MYERESKPAVPKACENIHNLIDTLKYAQSALKIVPNLPKGKLRDTLEDEINAIVNVEESYIGQVRQDVAEITIYLESNKKVLEEFKDLRQPCITDINRFMDIVQELADKVDFLYNRLTRRASGV